METDEQSPELPKKKSTKMADIHFRVTQHDKDIMLANAVAAGTDLSKYLLARGLKRPARKTAPATGDRRKLIEALGELGKIGSNINQIARATNRGRTLQEAAIVYALNQVGELGDIVREILINEKQ